ncbi:hypothetical protein [Leyella stercorea]|uniref:hypothetical protein n=1 Tax=Leyella stercorea TaxID=363265 RepID=UPI003FEF5403
MLLFVKSAKFRKKLNLQKNTQAKKRAKVSASSQTATPRHLRHASGKKSEGLGITTFLRHESGRHRQKAHRTGTKADTTGRKQAQKARHSTPEHRAVMGLW